MPSIGRPDILWSVNKFARAVTKWTRVCDKRLARLISSVHYTSEFKQYCHVGITAQQCRLDIFQDSDFAGDVKTQKSTSGGIGENPVYPWQSHVSSHKLDCKKQTSVSHSSTESYSITLDASSRMDGIPALDLCYWFLKCSILSLTNHWCDTLHFEDNEAVIKMIMKSRNPTLRHVSRTYRVALDWLFDRISLNPEIQINYVDTKHQLADILAKGNFTRDE